MWHAPRFPGRILFPSRDRGPTGSRRSPHRRRSAVYRLEALEGRALLSTTWTVTDNSDSGPGSLRQAILDAASGDTITIKPNVHQITLITGELKIDKSLDIEGRGNVTISGDDASRVFDILSGTVTIAGLTITHGRADGNLLLSDSPCVGGGILNRNGGDLTLRDDVLSDNLALGDKNVVPNPTGFPGGARGGGASNDGTLTVIACQFINNQARGDDGSSGGNVAGAGSGGGIGNSPTAGPVSIRDSLFVDNVAQGGSGGNSLPGPFAGLGFGGAIVNSSGFELDVLNSTFRHNQARGGNNNSGSFTTGAGVGGAIGSGRGGGLTQSVVVSGSTFVDNQAVGGNDNSVSSGETGRHGPNLGLGGAIAIVRGSGKISDSTFRDNQARGGQGAAKSGDGDGGGIYGAPLLGTTASVTVSDSTVDRNTALGGPGEFGGNGGNGFGGGLYNEATLTLTDATVKHNFALGGAAGAGGSDGEGIGGGLYNLGAITPGSTYVIKKNHASTSNDDIFP